MNLRKMLHHIEGIYVIYGNGFWVMSAIERAVMPVFAKKVRPGKVLLLMGARRVGKSELIAAYLARQEPGSYLLLNGEEQRTADLMAERSEANFRRLMGKQKLLVIDEAQKIPDIGLKLKLLVDTLKDVAVIVTGSSMFDLTNRLGEPLVGRSNMLRLHPLAQMEFSPTETFPDTMARLEERMVFGGYPELLQYPDWRDKAEYLRGMVDSYLLRDILSYDGIRKSEKLMDLLRLIAFQVGHEVGADELSNSIKGLSRNTVESYLDMLTKVFVLYKVRGYSRNMRKEVTKNHRWFFCDTGVRNAVIGNFSPFAMRPDVGQLWENYMMNERRKLIDYTERQADHYFWRTYDRQEIDLVEEEGGQVRAFEFKWLDTAKVRVPGGWAKTYPDATFDVVRPMTHLTFIEPI